MQMHNCALVLCDQVNTKLKLKGSNSILHTQTDTPCTEPWELATPPLTPPPLLSTGIWLECSKLDIILTFKVYLININITSYTHKGCV